MTKYDIIRIAKEVGLPTWYQDNALANESLIVKFATLAYEAGRKDENEACAKVCEPQDQHDDPLTAWKIATAIRARREQ